MKDNGQYTPPECCKDCPRGSSPRKCGGAYLECERWLSYFREKWAGIREAARRIKEAKK